MNVQPDIIDFLCYLLICNQKTAKIPVFFSLFSGIQLSFSKQVLYYHPKVYVKFFNSPTWTWSDNKGTSQRVLSSECLLSGQNGWGASSDLHLANRVLLHFLHHDGLGQCCHWFYAPPHVTAQYFSCSGKKPLQFFSIWCT